MLDPEQIVAVLNQHPEITTIEDAIENCKADGVEAGFWSVYFAARDIGRELNRRPPAQFNESDLRDLALIFFGLHKGRKHALATLNKLHEMNDSGTRVDWQSEKSSTSYGWEFSVGQELADLSGGIPRARMIVNKL